MTDDVRQQVLDNARYLRNVRPIDPEKVSEYIADQPHPAVVRRHLREAAPDLGLVERADGTFVPVEEGPLDVVFHGVDAFPDTYARTLEDLLVEAHGADWPEGESGDALRETIRRLKADYVRQHPVEYDHDTALGYAVYHLPDYYAAVQYVLAELAAADLLPRTLRVLDVGAGVGGPALGLHDLVFGSPDAEGDGDESAPPPLVDHHAVEPSTAADVLAELLDGTARNFRTTIHRETAAAATPEGKFDLVLFANVLSELDDPEAVARDYLDRVTEDGSLVALAPADRNTATGLREVERALANDGPATVSAPTARLWPGHAPTDRGWTFDVKPDLDVPGFQRRLDEACTDPDHAPGEFVNVDVQYAYSVLRRDGMRAIEFTPAPDRAAKMAEMERHVTERIDLYGVKLSHDLADDGNPLFKVGDGSQSVDHYAVLAGESALNRDLRTADYGDLLRFENVLALWNDDEEAYNLVVYEETVVKRVPA
jgi:SAM-dependent methyltransferase